jgi:predicted lipoprotein
MALAIALALLTATAASAGVDHASIAKDALQNYIRPGYARLAADTAALDRKMAALCQAPSAAAVQAAKGGFAQAVGAWSYVEPIRFGPVEQDHRHDRIFYWPDPKGLGTRQLREVLSKQDRSATDPSTLADKSVALQGLPALEYLLYGDDADRLTEKNDAGAFRCAFAKAVAANLVGLAKTLDDDWRDGAPYAKAYLAPAPDNSAYHAPKEVSLDLFKTFSAGIEGVRDQKLGKVLGDSPEHARPKTAPFWRSDLTFDNMAGNLEGVRDLFAKGGFAGIVRSQSEGVEDSILFDLNYAIRRLREIKLPTEQAFSDADPRAKLEALRVSLKSASATAEEMIAKGADLSFGFNAMDGD